MIDTYSSLRGADGNFVDGRTKLFVRQYDATTGDILTYQSGALVVPEEHGVLFIVDDWVIPQIDKIRFVDGTLLVKDGEELIPPVKSEKEKQREELLRQLALLDADTEESTEQPAE